MWNYDDIWAHDASDFYRVEGVVTHCDGDSKTAVIDRSGEEE